MKRRRVISSCFSTGSISIHAEQPLWSDSAHRSHRSVSAEAFPVKWMCRVTLNLEWSAVFNFKTHSFEFHQAAPDGVGGSTPVGREERSSGRGSWPNLTDWGFSSSYPPTGLRRLSNSFHIVYAEVWQTKDCLFNKQCLSIPVAKQWQLNK